MTTGLTHNRHLTAWPRGLDNEDRAGSVTVQFNSQMHHLITQAAATTNKDSAQFIRDAALQIAQQIDEMLRTIEAPDSASSTNDLVGTDDKIYGG